ncbi:hypothetical protein NEF87_002831 [Candidatus Lokiarchaeum ossiferum]|uniref:Radical SAM core domain-containing protein n=1 Tax=Candidatus Lokiarchaeum ossiferum TaxID=2951803 RepID=A0ABY6HVC5_9ARCH|nr:hypothetical protein NEF87_002831 [Candidatus Lokiarchaeum sp. B-35]
MKLLVVDCLTAGDGERVFTRDFIGSGPRYVAGFIEEISDYQIETSLMRGEDFLSLETDMLKIFNIICISAMTMDLGIVKKIMNKWHFTHPSHHKTLSLIGGPISSDKNILYKVNCDISIQKEGEIALNMLFKNELSNLISNLNGNNLEWKQKFFDKIPGILYLKQANVFHQNPIPPNLKNSWFQNTTGYPQKIQAYQDFKYARIFVECLRGCSNFRRTALTLSSGDCCDDSQCNQCREDNFITQLSCPANIPAGCGFCSTINEFGAPKSRSINGIIEEIQYLINIGACRIVLGGPGFLDFQRENLVEGKLINPTFPEPNYRALNELIDKLINIPEIHDRTVQVFIENIKAGLCSDRALDIIAKLPNAVFSIGCETGSNEFANILGRPGMPQTTLEAVKRALNRKIRVHVYFIHSLPGDNVFYANETLALMKKFGQIGVDKITLYKYQELPGSPFHNIPRHYKQFDKKTLKVFNKIKKFVIHYNGQQKMKLLGKKVRVFLSEENTTHPKDAIGWILEGGPKVSVINSVHLVGTFQDITIIQVLSDKLVLGKIN